MTTLMGISSVNAQGGTAANDNQWHYSAGVYLWAAGMGGETSDGTDFDISFSDLADNLNLGLMAAFGARKGEWELIADLLYLDISAKDTITTSIPVGPGAIDVNAKAELDLTGSVLKLRAGYNLMDEGGNQLGLFGGARYLDLDADVDISNTALGPERSISLSESGDVWDAIVGVKGRVALAERWWIPYYLDVGTGDSDLTYQVATGIGFQASDKWNVNLLYRYLYWDFGSGKVLKDLNFEGFMLGTVYNF
jgi:opacity protein-like surface antigen